MKLTKIKLINWHIFSNNTIELDGNTLITGENASGKSTLMDAIYFVLSGGDSKHFNKAANDSSQRTLESYLRGKIGSENQTYLRPGTDVIGYVMLEFVDNKKRQSLVLGAEMEIVSSSLNKPSFFVIHNYSINDNDFIKDKKVEDFKKIKSYFKTTKYQLDEINDSIRDRKRIIGRDIFKLDNYSRYFELLQNAISFKPISEVSSFVNSFLLEEDDIDLKDLKGEIRSYQDIHKMVIKEREKIDALKDFTPKAEKYIENKNSMLYLDALKIAVRINKINNQINRNSNELIRIEDNLKLLEQEEKMLKEKEIELEIELSQLKDNEAYKALEFKKSKLHTMEEDLAKAKAKQDQFVKLISEEYRLSRKLNMTYRFDVDLKAKDYALLKGHLISYKKELDETKFNIDSDIADRKNKFARNCSILKSKREQLDDLKKGINNYPDDVKNLIQIAKNAITEAYPKIKNPEVCPLCEYIEIKEDKWTNALEGYLNSQRFNLIVEPKFYDIVTKAYNEHKNEKRVFVSGIVNAGRIPGVRETKNSMMSKIEVSNKLARKYAEYLLGNLVCVENVTDLKNFDCSITPEVMIYKNYVLKACKPEIYRTPFIGKASKEKRIEILTEEIQNLGKECDALTNEIEKKSQLSKDIAGSNIRSILDIENPWGIVDSLQKNIEELKEEISTDQKEKGLFETNNRIESTEKRIEDARNKFYLIKDKEKENFTSKGQLENKINSDKESLNKEKNDQSIALSRLDKMKYEEIYNSYLSNGWLNEELIFKKYETAQKSNNSSENDLMFTMRKYSSTYKASLTPIIENLQDFVNEYYNLINYGVVEYERKAKEVYENAEKSFRENFLAKLKEKIDKSQRMLDKLNKTLQSHPFGNDQEIYKFYYEPTKESEFYNYYKIIMSGKLMDFKNLFSEVLDEKEISLMMDLFNKISMEQSSVEAEKYIHKYLDYRNYMNYDILITNKDGDKSYFSKINKEKSGGETQTPFYIVIASCFDELMHKDSSKGESTSLVVFDEAFNNMDESRIKSLMEFYKNLNIQTLIIVPSIRSVTISPYMDTLIGIAKNNNHPQIITVGK